MKTIDLHVHLGDIFCGHDTSHHLRKQTGLSHFLPRLNEYLGFSLMHHPVIRKWQDPKSTWQFSQDCIGVSDVSHLTQSLDRHHIDRACVLAVEPYVKTEWVASLVKAEPRIIPILSISPKDEDMKEKVARYVQLGCRGMKLHPNIQEFSPKEPAAFKLIEAIEPHKLPVICHTGCFSIPHLEHTREYGDIDNYVPLIEAFPDVPFVIAHMNLLDPEKSFRIAQRFNNVYLETSWQTARNIGQAITEVGSERILYGSDWPYAYQHTSMNTIKKACQTAKSLEDILYRNAERLLGLK